MDTRTTRSTAENAVKSPLYHHERWGAYECLGCNELIEIPALAVLAAGRLPVRIKTNPENLLIWVEMIELDHAKCSSFKDAKMARDARTFRKPMLRMGHA
jgi:hypothetical protein